MFNVENKKTEEILKVYGVKKEGHYKTEFLFYEKHLGWYWANADKYRPVE